MATSDTQAAVANLVSFEAWYRALGISERTAHRYRERGMITTQNIFGKLYVTRDEIARFEARVGAGEFAKDRGRPLRAKKSASQACPKTCQFFSSSGAAITR